MLERSFLRHYRDCTVLQYTFSQIKPHNLVVIAETNTFFIYQLKKYLLLFYLATYKATETK